MLRICTTARRCRVYEPYTTNCHIIKNQFTEVELTTIAQALGQSQNQTIYSETFNVTLPTHFKHMYHQNRRKTQSSTSSISGCTLPHSIAHCPSQWLTKKGKLWLWNTLICTRLSFHWPNLFQSHLTHFYSKSACKIFSHFAPFGSYTSLIQWLGEQNQTPYSPPTHDILTFFDNNQVACKNHVKINSAMKNVNHHISHPHRIKRQHQFAIRHQVMSLPMVAWFPAQSWAKPGVESISSTKKAGGNCYLCLCWQFSVCLHVCIWNPKRC